MKVKIVAITKPVELETIESLCEYAGRVCTNTTDKTGNNTKNFLKIRIKQGHESILEHVSVTFEISEISRACMAQLTRYRIASFSVESQRYVKYDGNRTGLNFVFPIYATSEEEQYISRAYNFAFDTYKKLIDIGMNHEDARMVLPNAKTTRLLMTMNLRELRHFLSQRLAPEAQWEIKQLAKRILEIMLKIAPTVFEDIENIDKKVLL